MLEANRSILFSNDHWWLALERGNYPYAEDDAVAQKMLDGDYIGAEAIIGEIDTEELLDDVPPLLFEFPGLENIPIYSLSFAA